MTRTPDWRDVALADRDGDLLELHCTLGYVRGCLTVALGSTKLPGDIGRVLKDAEMAIARHHAELAERQKARRERDAAGYGPAPECAGGSK